MPTTTMAETCGAMGGCLDISKRMFSPRPEDMSDDCGCPGSHRLRVKRDLGIIIMSGGISQTMNGKRGGWQCIWDTMTILTDDDLGL